jgi:hypothetical protein
VVERQRQQREDALQEQLRNRTAHDKVVTAARVADGSIEFGFYAIVLGIAAPPLIPVVWPWGIYEMVGGWWNRRKYKGVDRERQYRDNMPVVGR